MYFIDFKQHVCVSMSSTVILVNSSESDTGDVCLPSSISAFRNNTDFSGMFDKVKLKLSKVREANISSEVCYGNLSSYEQDGNKPTSLCKQ